MHSYVRRDVVPLNSGGPASTPSASQAQIIRALPSDMDIAKMVLYVPNRLVSDNRSQLQEQREKKASRVSTSQSLGIEQKQLGTKGRAISINPPQTRRSFLLSLSTSSFLISSPLFRRQLSAVFAHHVTLQKISPSTRITEIPREHEK